LGPSKVQGRLELQRSWGLRSGVGHSICIHSVRTEDGHLHLPDTHSGSRIHLCSVVSAVLLVHGKAEYGQHRSHRPLLGGCIWTGVSAYLPSGHLSPLPGTTRTMKLTDLKDLRVIKKSLSISPIWIVTGEV